MADSTEGKGESNSSGESARNRISYAMITWDIVNFSFTMNPPHFVQESPGFWISGPVRTAWVLSFQILQRKKTLVLYLEMNDMDCDMFASDEKTFKINFMADVLDANGEHAWGSEQELRIKFTQRMAVKTFQLDDLKKVMPLQGPDRLAIRCYLLVDFGILPVTAPNVSPGISSLSSELLTLLKKPFYSDIAIGRGENCYYLHKDMLLNRGSGLAALIMSRSSNDVIKLLNYEDKSLQPIFEYLYSGDLRFTYEDPRIMTYDIMERWKIPELEYSYPKVEIAVESILNCKENTFEWNIENFDDLGHSFKGSKLETEDSCWQIHVHPKGQADGKNQLKNFVILEAQLLKNKTLQPLNVRIVFTCVNEQNSIVYANRVQGIFDTGDKSSLEFFLRNGTLMKRCLVKKTLRLRIEVCILSGTFTNPVRNICPPHPYDFDNNQSFLFFSKSMRSVLENPLNTDVTVCNASVGVKAHRFVLGARSSIFYGKLNDREDIVSVPAVNTLVLRKFLDYLYTGTSENLDKAENLHVIALYGMGTAFCVPALLALCSIFLDVNPDNVLDVLEVAHARKLAKLKTEAFHTLAFVGPDIVTYSIWDSFKDRNPDLAKDVTEYLDKTFGAKKCLD